MAPLDAPWRFGRRGRGGFRGKRAFCRGPRSSNAEIRTPATARAILWEARGRGLLFFRPDRNWSRKLSRAARIGAVLFSSIMLAPEIDSPYRSGY